jgi:spore maturation protein B
LKVLKGTNVSDYIIPIIFAAVLIYGIYKKTDIFGEFTKGVKDGLNTVKDIFPSLFTLVICVGMLRASGAIETLCSFIAPLTDKLGFPREVIPLYLLRPFSGSGALAIAENIIRDNGADSFAGKVAAVVLGSSETTFYTLAVYFSATKVKRTRYALAAALVGDVAMWFLAPIAVRLFC